VPDRTVGQAVPPERLPFRPPASAGVQEPMPMPKPRQTPQSPVPAAAPPPPQQGGWRRSTTVVKVGAPDPSLRVSQPHMALPAVTGAAEAAPLQAALDAVHAAVATYGEDWPTLLEEVWSVCGGRT